MFAENCGTDGGGEGLVEGPNGFLACIGEIAFDGEAILSFFMCFILIVNNLNIKLDYQILKTILW